MNQLSTVRYLCFYILVIKKLFSDEHNCSYAFSTSMVIFKKKKIELFLLKCLQSIKEGKIWIGKFRAVWDRDWRDLGDLSCEFTEMRCHSDYSNSQDMNKLYWAHGICVTVNRFNIVTFMFFILRTLNESELIGKRISSGGHHC